MDGRFQERAGRGVFPPVHGHVQPGAIHGQAIKQPAGEQVPIIRQAHHHLPHAGGGPVRPTGFHIGDGKDRARPQLQRDGPADGHRLAPELRQSPLGDGTAQAIALRQKSSGEQAEKHHYGREADHPDAADDPAHPHPCHAVPLHPRPDIAAPPRPTMRPKAAPNPPRCTPPLRARCAPSAGGREGRRDGAERLQVGRHVPAQARLGGRDGEDLLAVRLQLGKIHPQHVRAVHGHHIIDLVGVVGDGSPAGRPGIRGIAAGRVVRPERHRHVAHHPSQMASVVSAGGGSVFR